MKKILKYFYDKICGIKNTHHTEIRFTFDQYNNNPHVTLHLSDLNDKTADELAKIFYIFQTGAVQQFLIDKISHISSENNVLFLENVYNSFNKLVPENQEYKNIKNPRQPMIRPIAVFNSHASSKLND